MLAGYLTDTNNTSFATMETAGLFSDMTTETSWANTSTVLSNYVASIGTWGADLASVFSLMTLAADKRAALSAAATNATLGTSTISLYTAFHAANGTSTLFSDSLPATWGTAASDGSGTGLYQALYNYAYASHSGDLTNVLALAATKANQRIMLSGYLTDTHNSSFAASVTAGLFSDMTSETTWSNTSTVLSNYATAFAVWGADVTSLMALMTLASDKRAALAAAATNATLGTSTVSLYTAFHGANGTSTLFSDSSPSTWGTAASDGSGTG
jgi:hypothetical protein